MKWFGRKDTFISSIKRLSLGCWQLWECNDSAWDCASWWRSVGWNRSRFYGEGGACEKNRMGVRSWKPAAVGRWTKKSAHITLTSMEPGFRMCAEEADLSWGMGRRMVWTHWYIAAIQAQWRYWRLSPLHMQYFLYRFPCELHSPRPTWQTGTSARRHPPPPPNLPIWPLRGSKGPGLFLFQ